MFRKFLVFILIIIYSIVPIFAQASLATPIVTTSEASSLGATSATLNGSITNNDGIHWTETSAPEGYWHDTISSSDGQRVAIGGADDYIYTSSDGGTNWTHQLHVSSPAATFPQFASTPDGSKLVVTDWELSIYYSSDYGVTWTETNSGSHTWRSVDISSDGTKIIASFGDIDISGQPGNVYISNDSGANWTSYEVELGQRYWSEVVMSDNGQIIVAVDDSGAYSYISIDGGSNWTETSLSQSISLKLVDMSSDGSVIVATSPADGYLYKSINSGTSWSQIAGIGPSQDVWSTLSISADGNTIGVADNNDKKVYISTDGGITWDVQDELSSLGKEWRGLDIISDGTQMYTGQYNLPGSIYKGVLYEDPTVRGFVYGLTTDYGATTTESGSFDAGAFTSSITGLTCATTYHYKAYATNSAGTTYGSTDTTFTTSACPVEESTPVARSGGHSSGGRGYINNGLFIIPISTPTIDLVQTPTSTPISITIPAITFKTPIYRFQGQRGLDIKELQIFLNKNGFTVSDTGAGSIGNETTYFGIKTFNALKKYQKSVGLPSFGIFGPMTREKMRISN